MEISVVTFPANGQARIEGAKAADVARLTKADVPELRTLADAEAFLRQAGMSRGAATAIVSQVRDLGRGDPGAPQPGDDTGDALTRLQAAIQVPS